MNWLCSSGGSKRSGEVDCLGSEGDTCEDALANIREAIELYLDVCEDDLVGHPHAEQLDLVV